MKSPPFLQRGDRIGIISTARKIDRATLKHAIKIFESWGLEVKLGKTIGASHHQQAGGDALRADDLQSMINDPDIEAVICARGGNGTVKIVDRVDFTPLEKDPKWIVGFSDVTVLHSHIHQHIGIQTIHGTMPLTFPKNGIPNHAVHTLRKALFGERLCYTFPTSKLHRTGTCEAVLTGGNVSTLFSLFASPSDIDPNNEVLFLEEVDEYLYHLDRMMVNFKRSGKLDRLAGLVIGGLTKIKDDEPPYGATAEEIIWEAVQDDNYPVTFRLPAGHIQDNCALRLGGRVRLEVKSDESRLIFL